MQVAMWFTTGMTKPQPTAAPRRAAVATALPVSTTTTYSAQAVSSSNDSKLEEIVQDSDTDIIGTGGGLYSSAPPGGGEPGGSSSNNPSSAGGESPSLMHRSHLRVTPPVKSHLASSRSLTAAGNPRSGPSSPALVGFGRAGLSVRCVLLFLFLASAASVALLGQWAASPDCSPISG